MNFQVEGNVLIHNIFVVVPTQLKSLIFIVFFFNGKGPQVTASRAHESHNMAPVMRDRTRIQTQYPSS